MGRILLLVELKGGNDGLNTVIPYADAKYRELRPGIGVARDHTIQLDEKVGLHSKLEPLMESWKAGDLAIVQGVGYPYPNRSHFRSIEIWDTASASNQTLSEGWIAQAFQGATLRQGRGRRQHRRRHQCAAQHRAGPAHHRHAGRRELPAPGAGAQGRRRHRRTAAIRRCAICWRCARRSTPRPRAWPTSCALRAAPTEAYPQEVLLGRQLDLATRVITARVPVVAIKAALGGFDTHANQVQPHERLLGFLADESRDPAQEPDRRQPVERRGGDDLLGVRPPRAAERQRRHRSRHGGAAVRDGRRREGRPARRLSVAIRPAPTATSSTPSISAASSPRWRRAAGASSATSG